MNTMVKTDIDALERDLNARIAAADDEAGLEAERVAALGKKGAVSELLKGLGAMTPEERRHPRVLNGSRRKRIARGSGTTVQEVNRLLKQFEEMNRMMKQLRGTIRGR